MDIYRSTHVELLLTQHKAQTTLHALFFFFLKRVMSIYSLIVSWADVLLDWNSVLFAAILEDLLLRLQHCHQLNFDLESRHDYLVV